MLPFFCVSIFAALVHDQNHQLVILILVMSWHEKYDYFVHCSHLVAFFFLLFIIIIYLLESTNTVTPNSRDGWMNKPNNSSTLIIFSSSSVDVNAECRIFLIFLIFIIRIKWESFSIALHISHVCCTDAKKKTAASLQHLHWMVHLSTEKLDDNEKKIKLYCARISNHLSLKSQLDDVENGCSRNYAKCDKKFGRNSANGSNVTDQFRLTIIFWLP